MLKGVMIFFGILFTAIGMIGVVTPLLPTTPFLLLAAACFARSSDKFHSWLVHHPKFGPPIADWQNRGAMGLRAKIFATILIVINAAFPLFIIDQITTGVRIGIGLLMAGVLAFIWSRPS